jgi:hypothetical protein
LNTKTIDIFHFKQFVKTHSAVLYPAFVLQSKLRKGILGPDFWEEQACRRDSISNGEYIPLSDLLKTGHIINYDKGQQYVHTLSSEVYNNTKDQSISDVCVSKVSVV